MRERWGWGERKWDNPSLPLKDWERMRRHPAQTCARVLLVQRKTHQCLRVVQFIRVLGKQSEEQMCLVCFNSVLKTVRLGGKKQPRWQMSGETGMLFLKRVVVVTRPSRGQRHHCAATPLVPVTWEVLFHTWAVSNWLLCVELIMRFIKVCQESETTLKISIRYYYRGSVTVAQTSFDCEGWSKTSTAIKVSQTPNGLPLGGLYEQVSQHVYRRSVKCEERTTGINFPLITRLYRPQ